MFTFGDAADFMSTLTFLLACTLTASVAEKQPYFLKAIKPVTLMEAEYCTSDFLWDGSNSHHTYLSTKWSNFEKIFGLMDVYYSKGAAAIDQLRLQVSFQSH